MKSIILIAALAISFSIGARAQYAKGTWNSDVQLPNPYGNAASSPKVAVGFDGTVYAAFIYHNVANNKDEAMLQKSGDGGYTWQGLGSYSGGDKVTAIDLCTAGENAIDARVLLLCAFYRNPTVSSPNGSAFLGLEGLRQDGVTMANYNLSESSYDSADNRGYSSVSLCTDSKMKAGSSYPFALVAAACKGARPRDSLITWSSKDGGATFVRTQAGSTIGYYANVSASAGVTAGQGYIRTGIAWEEIIGANNNLFANFLWADGTSMFGNASPYALGSGGHNTHPKIVCSQTHGTGGAGAPGSANDLNYPTCIVAYEQRNTGGGTNIVYYAMALGNVTPPIFTSAPLVLAANAKNAGGAYRAGSFDFTYYETATNHLLYHLISHLQFTSSNIADQPSSIFNYRDATTQITADVLPCVAEDPIKQLPVFCWSDGPLAMYDAMRSGLGVASDNDRTSISKMWPVPARDEVNISLVSGKDIGPAKAVIINSAGQQVSVKLINIRSGKNTMQLDLHDLPCGCYRMMLIGEGENYSAASFVIAR